MAIKISVVVPTYKRPMLLTKCLQTLAEQAFDNQTFEVIVVSDGPDDQTKRVVDEWMNTGQITIRSFALPYKQGPAAARNMGWKNAHGKLVAFTDDDCMADPLWLAELWKNHLENNASMVAYTGKIIVPLTSRPTDYELNTSRLEQAEFITANCACTKEALVKVNGFDEQFKMAWREDSDLHFKFLESGIPIIRLEKAVVVHPVRQARWGVSLKEQKKSMFNALLYKKYPTLYRTKIQQRPPWLYYLIIFSFLAFMAGWLYGFSTLKAVSLCSWFIFTLIFTIKRLMDTSWSPSHVMEMIVTSLLIPFLSIFWRFYGSWKFKTLFI